MEKESKLREMMNLIEKNLDNLQNSPERILYKWLHSINDEDIDIDWSAESLVLYGSSNIQEIQNYYQSENFNDAWFIIGDIHSDPIILDIITGKILFTRHDINDFNPIEIANNLNEFLKSLKIYIHEYYLVFDEKILDEAYEVKNNFIIALREKLQIFLKFPRLDNFLSTITY